jgi:hypothetical protein
LAEEDLDLPRPLPGEEGGEAAAFAVWRGTAPDWRRVVTIAGDGRKLLGETEARTAVRVSGVDRVPQSIEPLLFVNADVVCRDVVPMSRMRGSELATHIGGAFRFGFGFS